jgi:two-component system response regulator
MADDDADDRTLVQDAFREARIEGDLAFVGDGAQLIEYLRRSAGQRGDAEAPAFVLLDLNMPNKDGREALAEIRADPALRHVPVVVFSTSANAKDVLGSYRAGANSYIVKPSSYEDYLKLARDLARYWLEWVRLPNLPAGQAP